MCKYNIEIFSDKIWHVNIKYHTTLINCTIGSINFVTRPLQNDPK
jgi:hypothetical protein